MPYGDDLDQRFNELVAQIDAEERRRMRSSAAKQARAARRESPKAPSRPSRRSGPVARREPRRKVRRGWLLTAGISVVLIAALLVSTFRPDLFVPTGAIP
ncbi:hypothetical protein [Nonomuraea sp. NPDC050643]|uniref:hypothetical protein n=1 Tax=Nonomuraea sp. NPDC050643 TaxID=3155660 RepID=UPI0033C5E666